jgi:hypothetical protein
MFVDMKAFRGDVIGCEIVYEEGRYAPVNTISVHFTLNGKHIDTASLTTGSHGQYPGHKFFPYVGIGLKGISLLFRVSILF